MTPSFGKPIQKPFVIAAHTQGSEKDIVHEYFECFECRGAAGDGG